MKLLFIGDVFGDAGRRVLAEHLEEVQREFAVDFTIANAENCAGGRGITAPMVKKMRKYGVQVLTGGNHSTAHLEPFQDEKLAPFVLRPHNFTGVKSGSGVTIVEGPAGMRLGIVNLLGKTFISSKLKCPFKTADEILLDISEKCDFIFVDFHAEATSEKICFAHYLDGRVGAVIGTHTHVQTADQRILAGGTAFMTDAGMTGPEFSAIGMEHQPIIERLMHGTHHPFSQAKSDPMINGVVLTIDESTFKVTALEPVFQRYQFKD